MIVNACYWALGLDVPARTNVELVGEYHPLPFGFGTFAKGRKPEELR
jgi:hypothetical protein